jgi:hypothetical protein
MFDLVGPWSAVVLAGIIVGGVVLAGVLRRKPRPIPRKPPASPPHRPAFVLDTTGRVHGASVLVNGVELNSVVADVVVISRPADIPRVELHLVPTDGVKVLLERADIRVDRSSKDIEASVTVLEAAQLIAYDRAGRHQAEVLVAKLKDIAADLRGSR